MTPQDLARTAARRGAPLVLRARGRVRELGPPFAVFERADGSRVSVLSGYRAAVKSTWPASWWAVDVLLRLGRRVSLPTAAAELVDAIGHAPALPVPVVDVAAALVDLRRVFPDELLGTGRHDVELGMEVLEIAPLAGEVMATAASYRTLAADVIRTAEAHGHGPAARILDVGTGSGYLAYALAGRVGGEVIGVDLDPETYVMPAERAALESALAADRSGDVRLERGDVHDLPYPDGSFDLVCSMTAVEHFADLERAVAEMARVLRPGGLMLHGVEPWFSKRGGHGLLTLDFPWGHVRLQPEELERYLRELRPHEADSALAYHRTGFQRPALTLDESRSTFARHVEVVEWREVEARTLDVHLALCTAAVLRDCRARFPSVTRRDLLTLTYLVVGRR